MKSIRVSILGLGTIGTKLLEYLQLNMQTLKEEYQIDLHISGIYVKNLYKVREADCSNLIVTDNAKAVIDEADLVFECIGGNGAETTKELLLYALQQRKAVILSSKKCLATYGEVLQRVAEEHQVSIRYDACVGGGIPISSVLENMGKCEKIVRIYGICNATSNYVLTQMTKHQVSYQEALAQAKKMGIAENDSSEDVNGYDALYKAIILCGFGLGKWIPTENVYPESICNLTHKEISDAKERNCVMKPLFDIRVTSDNVVCSVGPKYIPRGELISCTEDTNNIIIEGSESGERAFYGLGAGAKPTASAMYDDFIQILKHKMAEVSMIY